MYFAGKIGDQRLMYGHFVYSYSCRIPLGKSTNIRVAIRGKAEKTRTGFFKIDGSSGGCIGLICPPLLRSCQKKSMVVALNILLL